MIPNYAKYIFYIMFLSAGIGGAIWCKNAIESYKDNAVRAALEEVKTQQKDITIEKQDDVIKHHSVVFKKSQQIMKESIQKNKEIESAVAVDDKVKVRYEIIEEMNCRINNFSLDVCPLKKSQ